MMLADAPTVVLVETLQGHSVQGEPNIRKRILHGFKHGRQVSNLSGSRIAKMALCLLQVLRRVHERGGSGIPSPPHDGCESEWGFMLGRACNM